MQSKMEPSAIEKFLSNSCDHVEAERVANYLSQNEAALDSIEMFNNPEDDLVVSYDTKEQLLDEILMHKESRVFSIKKLLIAASLIGTIILGWYFINNNSNKSDTVAISDTYIKNKTTGILDYTLPDSSKITLMPGAEILYKSDFTTKRNVVHLNGDVFFKVQHDKENPFSVAANGINTTVLGTQFWIRNFTNSNTLSISLNEGKIAINSIDKDFTMGQVVLEPGQVCFIDKVKGSVNVSGINDSKKKIASPSSKIITVPKKVDAKVNEVVWTNTDMSFNNTSLENVLKRLEQRYHVKIIVENKADINSYLTGKIFYSDSLETILKSITELNNLSYEIRNDSVFIRKK